jgi:hypothetical protein
MKKDAYGKFMMRLTAQDLKGFAGKKPAMVIICPPPPPVGGNGFITLHPLRKKALVINILMKNIFLYVG